MYIIVNDDSNNMHDLLNLRLVYSTLTFSPPKAETTTTTKTNMKT